jgi:flagellar hook-associated protein 2
MASPITFSGMASGIDTASLIDALVQNAQAPVNKLQKQKSDFSSQSKQITDIKTKLTALQTAAQALDTRSEALGNKTSSSDEKVLKATATGGAAMGAFKVTVSSLAQAERTYSNEFASDGTAGAGGVGKLSIKVGSADAVEIDVTADDTLATIAKKINESGAEVSAGIMNVGGKFRLQVTGNQSGEDNGITFGEDGTTLGLTLAANEKQKASSASIEVDGITIKSASNTVTGALPGVRLELTDVGTSTVKLDRDGDSLKTKLNTFISAYNSVMTTLNSAFTFTGTTKGTDTLAGDSTMKQLQSSLRSLAQKIQPNGNSSLTSFGSIGVATARDGTLSLDETKFNKAVSSDYEGVASLLAGRTDGQGLMKTVSSGLEMYTKSDGALKVKIDNLAARNKRIDTQITSVQARIDKYRETLERQYTALETTIAGLNSQGSSLSSIISSM